MEQRKFGKYPFNVSALGYGAGQIGDADISERDAEKLLNEILDLGITLLDTARGYGLSEERIGRYLARRRDDFILSTKVGYGIEGYQDWTYDCIRAGVDAALRRMNTDHIDIVHLHSCPRETLQTDDVIRALEESVQAGKVRVAAYSGENESLSWAVDSDRFGSVQHSLNICDQRVIDDALMKSRAKNLGVIAKRPVANVPWRFSERPVGDYSEEYWLRLKAMNIDPRDMDWQELALRFTAYTPGVHSCVVATLNIEHLRQNAAIINKGALPAEQYDAIRTAFKSNDPGWWTGQL